MNTFHPHPWQALGPNTELLCMALECLPGPIQLYLLALGSVAVGVFLALSWRLFKFGLTGV